MFKSIILSSLVITTFVSLVSCSRIGNLIRDREFDYARQNIIKSRQLKIPESIPKNIRSVVSLTLEKTGTNTSILDRAHSVLIPTI
jgi:hypothetical protein